MIIFFKKIIWTILNIIIDFFLRLKFYNQNNNNIIFIYDNASNNTRRALISINLYDKYCTSNYFYQYIKSAPNEIFWPEELVGLKND